MKEQLEKGIIERVPDNEIDIVGHKIHYLPHHAVVTPLKSTTKVRIVFDASSKTSKDQLSLNEAMYRGPIILPMLCGMLLRFRIDPIVVLSDVEKAFLQLGLQTKERDATRFLYYKDFTKNATEDNIQVYRFTRVTFGVIASPFLLGATIAHHLDLNGGKTAELIKNNIYMDNVITTFNSSAELGRFYTESKDIFANANMNLREWITNNEEFQANLSENDQPKSTSQLIKVLGQQWCISTDTLTVSIKESLNDKSCRTKREVLMFLAYLFDPMGLISPVTLNGKLFLQELWKMKLTWDEPMKQNLKTRWDDIQQSILHNIGQLSFPRMISETSITHDITHAVYIFTDASAVAYSAVAYLVTKTPQKTQSMLLFTKSRLAPKKNMTIPRLELLGMLLGARLMHFVCAELKSKLEVIDQVILTDSECCLHWLNSKKSLSRFVSNRVSEIKDKASQVTFYKVPTSENPADLATRPGISTTNLIEDPNWQHGPIWLTQARENWPPQIWTLPEKNIDIATQIQSEYKADRHLMIEAVHEIPKNPIEIKRFSTVTKLVRTTIYVHRFLKMKIINRLSVDTLRKIQWASQVTTNFNEEVPITVNEMNYAQHYWERRTQQTYYSEVIKSVMDNKTHPLKKQFKLFLDIHAILRCSTRMDHSEMTFESRFPVLLPPQSEYTRLLIEHAHIKTMHSGTQSTLATLRREYWIPRGRATVRGVVQQCLTCKQHDGPHYKYPEMPPLPPLRVRRIRPFHHIGLDYFGPIITIKDNDLTKTWVALFTCTATRAVHLEPVMDYSSKQFISALRRFTSRRGCPETIISDHGKQFVLTQSMLEQFWCFLPTNDDINAYFATESINWMMIPEYSPWQGGMYERLVKSVRLSLRKAMGRKRMAIDELFTVLAEIEAVTNTRPLCYISDDIQSCDILTPNDFLTIDAPLSISLSSTDGDDNDPSYTPLLDNATKLLQVWQSGQNQLNRFWRRWQDEYLNSLKDRSFQKSKTRKSTTDTPVRLNEIVHIKEALQPRGSWQIGRISQLNVSADSKIRSADVTLPSGSVVTRPINLLYPMEVQRETPNSMPDTETTTDDSEVHTNFVNVKPRGLSASTVSMLCVALLFNLLQGVTTTKCDRNQNKLKAIHSETCVSNGITIMSQSNGYLCWTSRFCPTGHMDTRGNCGKYCPCPSWTKTCSHMPHQVENTTTSAINHILSINLPEHICSYTPDPVCDAIPIHTTAFQIETYDGERHLVDMLYITQHQNTIPICVGEGPATGTALYCSQNQCVSKGSKLCYYTSQEITYFANNLGQVQVKAWGTVPIIYYPRKITLRSITEDCKACGLQCIKGGVKIQLDPNINISMIELCSTPYCYKISWPRSEESMMFPADVNLDKHKIDANVWYKGIIIQKMTIECQSTLFCESIECIICIANLSNPQCWSMSVSLGIGVAIYAALMLIIVIVKLAGICLYGIYYTSYISYKTTRSIVRFSRNAARRLLPRRQENGPELQQLIPLQQANEHANPRTQHIQSDVTENVPISSDDDDDSSTEAPPMSSTRSVNTHTPSRFKSKYLVNLIYLAVIIRMTNACDEVTTLTAKRSSCTTDNQGEVRCSISETTRLALVPQGQSICLLVSNEVGDPLGTLDISIQRIALTCQKKNKFFTRSFHMKVESAKRCSGAGSCGSNKCQDFNKDSKIEEFNGEANNSPGVTQCMESCGCWACSCFYCTSACLFFRTFAKPSSSLVYEVYSCPVWVYEVTTSVKLLIQGQSAETMEFKVYPGRLQAWNNIRMTVIALTTPPPLLF